MTNGGESERLRKTLSKAVEQFSTDRGSAAEIRRYSETSSEDFVNVGIRLLLEAKEDAPGPRFLATQLLKHPALFSEITDPWLYTAPQSVALGRWLMTVEKTLDIRLARCLPLRTGDHDDCALTGPRAERALEILNEISVGRRVVPVLNHLTLDPDKRISSKAALLVGKRVQSLLWAKRLMAEATDPRLRANTLEALWGMDSPPARQFFRVCLNDDINRVVGNALMGMHLAGESDVAACACRVAKHLKPEFRSTAAWVMGKIGDPAYAAELTLMVKDTDPMVRSAALRALLEIRQVERCRTSREAAAEPCAATACATGAIPPEAAKTPEAGVPV